MVQKRNNGLGPPHPWPPPNTCPRRILDLGQNAFSQVRGIDVIDPDTDQCTFCHSMNPDTLIDLLARTSLDPADRVLAGQGPELDVRVWIVPTGTDYRAGVRIERTREDGSTETIKRHIMFHHMTDDQRSVFIDLMNDRRIRIWYPSYFYLMPYFMTVSEPGPEGRKPRPG